MTKRSLYQRPVARDLSGLAAYGAKPHVACSDGFAVYNTSCIDGHTVQGVHPVSCSPTGVGYSKHPPTPDCSGGTPTGIVGCDTGSTNS